MAKKKSTYLTDYWTTDDALKFSDFRPALEQILQTAETPLTVGVFGPWGSGKTSLMRMLRDKIESDGLDAQRTVWFTAWKYDQHEALWRAFILRVLDALYPREPGEGPREERAILTEPNENQKKLVQLLDKLEESVYQDVAWEELGPRSIRWWQLLSSTGKAGTEVAATVASGGLYPQIKKMLGGDDSPVDDIQKAAEAISRETKTRQRRQLFHMEQFEEMFREAVRLIGDGQGRLIIFVDDLDRCLPEKAIEVLEAIKLFLEVPGTVFVLGMDREVIQRGIEARYGGYFRQQIDDRRELPIRGDTYLQKIVQIPFHLPALALADLDDFIGSLDKSLNEMTRQVFARGLFPNPRTVKRALNIFRLLQTIAATRQADIAGPLLAKTVIIQTQYPPLYQQWRQYPTLIQTLEEEYTRRPTTEHELVRGRVARPQPVKEADEDAAAEEKRSGGLLDEYLEKREKYALLAQLLTYPLPEEAEKMAGPTRFAGLTREQMNAYLRLAGAVESDPALVDVPGEILDDLLSGDLAKIQDAAARIEDEAVRGETRQQMPTTMQNPQQPVAARVSAGNALAHLGDPRFREDAWFLPDEPLLGFVEIPAGPFWMGSDKAQDPQAEGNEIPQHQLDLPAFYIARYPVTVAQFRAFVDQGGYELETERGLHGGENHPVVYVSWRDALAYCQWLTERLRQWPDTPTALRELLQNGGCITLPSEAEWEKAARGHDKRIYPWGNDFDVDYANVKETGIGATSPVGAFPGGVSPFGLLDMSGNVWEWTRSHYEEYPYVLDDGREDLTASDKVWRVLRGGSCYFDAATARCPRRNFIDLPYVRYNLIGFRVAVAPCLPLPSGSSDL
ncbi:MAG TPA: hypothetical protein EYP41_05380 [Anaerolineae bacterium]|nr:hypothetical protein [Anaerolineae bacterium]